MTAKPETLGKYLVQDEIGRGGMGVVYRATHSETGQTVAMKVLPAELARDSGFADRFAREISTLQKLDHRNIVKLIEPGEDQGYQYYVMEYVEGQSLDKIIAAERRIPWARAVQIAIQICSGLKHAHDHGVIHRDLKPANLLIMTDGTVKLMDFGIAKVFAGTAITRTGGIIGTPEYMSPEQGDGHPVTRRTDLYSLGVVLYTMLTGRPPFIGRDVASLINLHRYGQFDRPMTLVPELPSWLDELVCQLLEKDPEKRPPDAHVVARRLEVVQKKVALRSAQTIVEGDATIEVEGPRRRRGIGPATLMQRLMRAQLRELDEPGWIQQQFQKTWVLVIGLVLAVGALTLFTVGNRSRVERRRWAAIEQAYAADDEHAGALLDLVRDYLDRYPNGPHATQARAILPEAESQRRRLEFLRSDAIKDLRPGPNPVSMIEKLYRRALLQLWLQSEQAARETLETIVNQPNVDAADQFLVHLAHEDLVALDLQRAERLSDEGKYDEAMQLLRAISLKEPASPKLKRLLNTARQELEVLERRLPTSDLPQANGAPTR